MVKAPVNTGRQGSLVGTANRPVDSSLTRRRWFLALVLSAGLAAVVITAARLTTSGANGAAGIPTDAEARSVLTETFERARRVADATAFCEPSAYPLSCETQYNERGGRSAVPAEAPRILESWATSSAHVLTVCGIDGQGKSYRSDFPVERGGGRLRAILDVFWDSKTYSGSRVDGDRVRASPGPQQFSC